MSKQGIADAVARHDLKQFVDELELKCVMSLDDARNLTGGVNLLFAALNAAATENNRLKDAVRDLTDQLSKSYLIHEARMLNVQQQNNELREQVRELEYMREQ